MLPCRLINLLLFDLVWLYFLGVLVQPIYCSDTGISKVTYIDSGDSLFVIATLVDHLGLSLVFEFLLLLLLPFNFHLHKLILLDELIFVQLIKVVIVCFWFRLVVRGLVLSGGLLIVGALMNGLSVDVNLLSDFVTLLLLLSFVTASIVLIVLLPFFVNLRLGTILREINGRRWIQSWCRYRG